MNIYVEPTGRRIQPFDDPIGDTPIKNRPLSAWQREAFFDGGFTVIEELEPPCLVVPDTVLTTGATLKRFVDGAAGRNAVFVLKKSLFGKSTTPIQPHVTEVEEGWRFEAIRFVDGADVEPIPVVVDPDEVVHSISLPRLYTGSDTIETGMPRYPIMTLHHWVHILWADHFMGGVILRNTPRWKVALGLIWAVIRAFSINKWKVLAKLNMRGPGCDIHPTAVVEGSRLGRDVIVGPHARVLFSTLGDKVVVMPGAQVDFSTLGEKAIVSEESVLRFSVLYPRAVSSQRLLQYSILGRETVTTNAGYSIDVNFDSEVKVALDGKLRNTGTRVLGSAYGHRCRIGTGIYIASGRTIPNDYFLIREPRSVLVQIPPGLEDQPLVASGSRARPVHLLGARNKKRREND